MNGTNVCVNIDECGLGNDNCDDNADCTDNDGSYECDCHDGESLIQALVALLRETKSRKVVCTLWSFSEMKLKLMSESKLYSEIPRKYVHFSNGINIYGTAI